MILRVTFVFLREIIDEELQVDQMSGRGRHPNSQYGSGQIMHDPNAPPKAPRIRHPVEPPMVGVRNSMGSGLPLVRVSSSDSGVGSRMSTIPHHSELPLPPQAQQQHYVPAHGDHMENWGEVCLI